MYLITNKALTMNANIRNNRSKLLMQEILKLTFSTSKMYVSRASSQKLHLPPIYCTTNASE